MSKKKVFLTSLAASVILYAMGIFGFGMTYGHVLLLTVILYVFSSAPGILWMIAFYKRYCLNLDPYRSYQALGTFFIGIVALPLLMLFYYLDAYIKDDL